MQFIQEGRHCKEVGGGHDSLQMGDELWRGVGNDCYGAIKPVGQYDCDERGNEIAERE